MFNVIYFNFLYSREQGKSHWTMPLNERPVFFFFFSSLQTFLCNNQKCDFKHFMNRGENGNLYVCECMTVCEWAQMCFSMCGCMFVYIRLHLCLYVHFQISQPPGSLQSLEKRNTTWIVFFLKSLFQCFVMWGLKEGIIKGPILFSMIYFSFY